MRDGSDGPFYLGQMICHRAVFSFQTKQKQHKTNINQINKKRLFIPIYIAGKLKKEGRKCFYLMTHSTHFIYGYMVSDIWLRTILAVRKENTQQGFFLYAPSHRQDNTYYGLWYTSRGALGGTRNSSLGPPHE